MGWQNWLVLMLKLERSLMCSYILQITTLNHTIYAISTLVEQSLIYTQDFIPDIDDPVEADGIISIIKMDTDDFLFEKKDFYFINEAIEYIVS